MKRYFRIMLGAKSMYAEQCFSGQFIGAHYDIDIDLSNDLPDNWREFNKKFIPIWLQKYPNRSKVAAGLSCGTLWTICKGLNIGDIVLCPNGKGSYYVGEIIKDYTYHQGEILPHRRKVKWLDRTIDRSEMSDELRHSSGSIGTSSDITKYAIEIETLIGSKIPPAITANDPEIEDAAEFALEKHLEEFLVQNWKNTELGKSYDIYKEAGELVGQQYQTDTGPIDILAISKDKKTLLVVELKKGRISDHVVGQVQRYMGYVLEEVAEQDQKVKGAIIALEDDLRLKRALSVASNIDFYKYKVSFKLYKD